MSREEINNLHTNVESLSNRINSASTIIANNNAPNEAYDNEPISSSIHSSPKIYDINPILTASIQPEKSQYTIVDDVNLNSSTNNKNFSNSNNISYEPTSLSAAQIENNVTPTKSIIRTNSIRNMNEIEDTPNYYNEPTVQPTSMSYVELQQPAGNI